MKVILTQNVARVGSKGDLVDLAEGYARNFIIKNRLGVEATPQAISQWTSRQKSKQAKIEKEYAKEFEFATKHKKEPLILKAKANENGNLFEKIDSNKLLNLINSESGANFTKQQVVMKNPIKELGDFEFELAVSNKCFKIPIKIVKE